MCRVGWCRLLLIFGGYFIVPQCKSQESPVVEKALGRAILQELIEINTTASAGDNTRAAELLAKRFRNAGFPPQDVHVLAPVPRKGNLVVRLRGGAHPPILWLGHLDVVEANKDDWSSDPFKFREHDGHFYGRGAYDNKAGAAILVTTFLRLKQEGFKPNRDLILVLTADEETPGEYNGVKWLLTNHRNLINAQYCINSDSGDGQMRGGRRILSPVQVGEKGAIGFSLEVKNPGGHSALPTQDNAIYRLAAALTRLSKHEFPPRLNSATRRYFERMSLPQTAIAADIKSLLTSTPDPASIERLAAIPYYNAVMRTTCTATRLEGGHAGNALPQTARAIINCRILPDESPDAVTRTIRTVVADESVIVTPSANPISGSLSRVDPAIFDKVSNIAATLWPGVPVVPTMEPFGSDGRFLRAAGIPTYGISGLFDDVDDVRSHGKDERISVRVFFDGLEFHYRLVKALTGGSQ